MSALPTHTQTTENLLFTAEELAKFAEEIRSIAERMKLMGISEMEVTHEDQRLKAVRFADNFSAAVRDALRAKVGPKDPDTKRVRTKPAKPEK